MEVVDLNSVEHNFIIIADQIINIDSCICSGNVTDRLVFSYKIESISVCMISKYKCHFTHIFFKA